MDRLVQISRRRKNAHAELLRLDSKVYAAFLKLEQATYADGALPRKTKELVAIGISVVINCESCRQGHIEQAARLGASRRELLEAVEVGIEMGGGPVALEVMDQVCKAAPLPGAGYKPLAPI